MADLTPSARTPFTMRTTRALRVGTTIVAVAACLFGAIPRAARSQEALPLPAAATTVPAPETPQAQQSPPGPGTNYRGSDNGPHFLFGDSQHRMPGLAVVLSLQPLPVDFGNLYAENLGWGVAYTAIEVSLAATEPV